MTLCTSSVDAVVGAVSRLALSDAPAGDTSAFAPISAALRDLYSGHLAVEAPDRVEATIAALYPVLCDESLAGRIDWALIFSRGECDDTGKNGVGNDLVSAGVDGGTDCLGGASFASDEDSGVRRTVALFADRSAGALAGGLDLAGSRFEGAPDDVFVGILGEATQSIQAISMLLRHGFVRPRPVLEDGVLADIVFACERVLTSCSPADVPTCEPRGSTSQLDAALVSVRREACGAAQFLLDDLPNYGKRTPTLPALITRVWASQSDRHSLHRHVMASLKNESRLTDTDAALERLGLKSAVCVARSLLVRLGEGSTSDLDCVLPLVLAEVLPVAGEISQRRRVEAIRTVSHCLKCASEDALAGHLGAIVAALTESLLQDDVDSAVEAHPALAHAMQLQYPVHLITQDPPSVWSGALEEIVVQFARFSTHSGEDSDDYIVAAASIGARIATVGGIRLVLHLSRLLPAYENLLKRTALLAARVGASAVGAYLCSCRALVDLIRHTWPRIPSHAPNLVRACFVSVLSARDLEQADELSMTAVIEAAADVIAHVAECGANDDKVVHILDGLRPTLEQFGSLGVASRLDEAARRRIPMDKVVEDVQRETVDSTFRKAEGSVVARFFETSSESAPK